MATVKFRPDIFVYTDMEYSIGHTVAWKPKPCFRCKERPAQIGAECNQCYKERFYEE
ncbi:hypothetical protein ANABIO4_38190 [Bacillus subtilis]|nr:hypothetical protein ANABIO4_38190 [Bacillus subtilis]